ncbi:MAG: hypothetical protein NWE98_00050 [Candidatus Bathyarchaeota archaeon]|nr:hypothetical protein [Candidatus Bathyarchaeota archaeon]
MNNIHFYSIKISNYRGRNFTLKMNPRGQNTVFVMDGNTGKTTTIELLRWCFGFPQSKAQGTFRHMWANPAHILDDTKKGPQVCEITIQFSAYDNAGEEHSFKFTRTAKGIHDTSYPPLNEKIFSIEDTLEIDKGADVKVNDDVFQYLSQEFRFNDCVEYFCFDGEKAREVMQIASDSKSLQILVGLINRRTTHPKLEEYKQKLNALRSRVLEEAKSRITDRALERNMNELNSILTDIDNATAELDDLKHKSESAKLALNQICEESQQIEDQITSAQVKEMVELNRLQTEQSRIIERVKQIRDSIYQQSQNWICPDVADEIQSIKKKVKEEGKLPEPYRSDLIHSCLTNKRCEICGRALDKEAEENVKRLELQVAPPNVHDFIAGSFSIHPCFFDSKANNVTVTQLIEQNMELEEKIKNVKLTNHDQELIEKKSIYAKRILAMQEEIARYEHDIDDRKEWIKALRTKKVELQAKNDALKENKIILDNIDETLRIIEEAEEKIKQKATEIISDVISEGVSSILGERFSAKFTQTEGLMLGEDGFYGIEKGGYSGRLVLSYCFAEAMTLIGPIIVDTPAGNIGIARPKLAAHLVANHNQVILLCLPTELEKFAEIVSKTAPIVITNNAEGT